MACPQEKTIRSEFPGIDAAICLTPPLFINVSLKKGLTRVLLFIIPSLSQRQQGPATADSQLLITQSLVTLQLQYTPISPILL